LLASSRRSADSIEHAWRRQRRHRGGPMLQGPKKPSRVTNPDDCQWHKDVPHRALPRPPSESRASPEHLTRHAHHDAGPREPRGRWHAVARRTQWMQRKGLVRAIERERLLAMMKARRAEGILEALRRMLPRSTPTSSTKSSGRLLKARRALPVHKLEHDGRRFHCPAAGSASAGSISTA
jgi:hypothetical protein